MLFVLLVLALPRPLVDAKGVELSVAVLAAPSVLVASVLATWLLEEKEVDAVGGCGSEAGDDVLVGGLSGMSFAPSCEHHRKRTPFGHKWMQCSMGSKRLRVLLVLMLSSSTHQKDSAQAKHA